MIMKKNVLWISLMAPYDGVQHASGKIENYHIKNLKKKTDYDIRLLTTVKEEEVSKLDLDKYNIRCDYCVRKRKGLSGVLYRGMAYLSKFNIFNKYAGLTPIDISTSIKKLLKKTVQENYYPDVIILDWTEILFMMPLIKKYYPLVPIVSIEEDVSYLGQYRHYEGASWGMAKLFYKFKYEKVKKMELDYLEQCELVVLNNRKDLQLIQNDGMNVDKCWVWAPFFQSYIDKQPQRKNNNIVFYGAMFREENWRSAAWFIEKVLPKIPYEDVQFVIVGGSPHANLYKYTDERIVIKGFVDDISEELSNAMCLAAPLVLGAGIKIKVLEAMSCGIPVLTNDIGIEGIPAENNKSYFHCQEADEYVEAIRKIYSGEVDAEYLGVEAKRVVKNNFDFLSDANTFTNKIIDLCKE